MLPKIATYARQHHLALIALFIALGGTSYAAAKLPKNSVGSKQIRSNAVSGPKVKNGSLLTEDFKAGSIPQGKAGDQGPKGADGAKGDPGPTTASASQTSRPDPVSYNPDASQTITTPTNGKLWIEGVDTYNATGCTSGTYSLALFLDGTYVPGTRRDQSLVDTVAQTGSVQTFGVAASAPAGLHTVALKSLMLSCSGGYGVDSQVGAIALG